MQEPAGAAPEGIIRHRIAELVRGPFLQHGNAASMGEMRLARVHVDTPAARGYLSVSIDWVAGSSPPVRGRSTQMFFLRDFEDDLPDIEGWVRNAWAQERLVRANLTALYRGNPRDIPVCGSFYSFLLDEMFSSIPTKGAEERGHRLLLDNLTPSQRQDFKAKRSFLVRGGETGTMYRVRSAHANNVDVLGWRRQRLRTLCFLPAGNLCMGDQLLAQKVALESFEVDALRVAIVTPR